VSDGVEERLATTTLALVDVASESLQEDSLTELIRATAPSRDGLVLADDEDSVLLFTPSARRESIPLVLFAGHTDTVPIAGNVPGVREGEVIIGRGASDMKSGLAVMLELMHSIESQGPSPDVDAAFLFFGREEIASDRSPLPALFARTPALAEAMLAIVMEPTDNALEIGCLGNVDALVTIGGVAAHSARPWLGDNAIHRALEALAPIADRPVRDVEIEGLVYREVVNVTEIRGGVASNVIPDSVSATVNFRYAPDRTPADAETWLRELVQRPGVTLDVRNNAGPGPVVVRNALVERLRVAGSLEVRSKQAWTPVAEFAAAGIDAVNCGPGDPKYAHTDDERVELAALVRSVEIMSAFLRPSWGR
jgi:succinyl-diaminopimelate desuccinylase